MFNEIDDDFDEVAIRTFKVGLPFEHGLRKSLTGKPVTNLRQLMDKVDKYKRIEDDQQQGKGKAKVIPQEMRDFKSDQYNNNWSRRVNQHLGCWCNLPRACASSIVKKSRMNPSSNGPTRWWEIPRSETVTFIANIIGIMDKIGRAHV